MLENAFVLENGFGAGKFWKLQIKVCGSC